MALDLLTKMQARNDRMAYGLHRANFGLLGPESLGPERQGPSAQPYGAYKEREIERKDERKKERKQERKKEGRLERKKECMKE
jgi:hypothetical protein